MEWDDPARRYTVCRRRGPQQVMIPSVRSLATGGVHTVVGSHKIGVPFRERKSPVAVVYFGAFTELSFE